MFGVLNRVGSGIAKAFGVVKEPLRRLGQVGYNVGRFAVQNHSTLAPLLHGIATASGNETARKITGGLLALSQTATMRQKLNADNQKIKAEMGRGGYGVFDAGAGKMSRYGT
jgi:hypothetical protein